MKQLWFGLGLLIMLLALCLGVRSALSSGSRECDTYLSRAETAAEAGDMAGAQSHTERAARSWRKHTPFIDAVTSHDETDEILRTFAELQVYAQTQRREEFLAGCARLRTMTEHLRQMEQAKWYNILCVSRKIALF